MKNELVVKSNRLVEASYRLDLIEQRIVLAAIVTARETQQGLGEGQIVLDAQKFADAFGMTGGAIYEQLKEAVNKLYHRSVVIRSPDSDYVDQVRWLSSAGYADKLGKVRLRFAQEVVPYITRLEKEYTSYRLEKIGRLTSAYAVRLYELLLQYKEIGSREVSIDWLKNTLQLADGYNGRTGVADFKKRVIDTSLKQINEHTDLSVTYENVKTGRSITGLLFSISERKAKPVPAKTKTEKPLLPLRITKAYIDKHNLGRVGESYDEAIQRLTQEALKQREKESK